jgi:hypothetical protein
MNNVEIGRELKAGELVEGTVVVVKPPSSPTNAVFTMWVAETNEKLVVLHSGVLKWSVINVVGPDGCLYDDQGRKVSVFEYLGKV